MKWHFVLNEQKRFEFKMNKWLDKETAAQRGEKVKKFARINKFYFWRKIGKFNLGLWLISKVAQIKPRSLTSIYSDRIYVYACNFYPYVNLSVLVPLLIHLFIDFNSVWVCTMMPCNTHVQFNCQCTLCTFESHFPSLLYLCWMSMWHLNVC